MRGRSGAAAVARPFGIHGNDKKTREYLVSFFGFSHGFCLIIGARYTIIHNEAYIGIFARILTETMQIRKEYVHLA